MAAAFAAGSYALCGVGPRRAQQQREAASVGLRRRIVQMNASSDGREPVSEAFKEELKRRSLTGVQAQPMKKKARRSCAPV